MDIVNTPGQDLWYRNRLVWLVIAIPTLTIAGCALTIFLALSNPHQEVADGDNIAAAKVPLGN